MLESVHGSAETGNSQSNSRLVELILDDMALEEMTIVKGAVLRDPHLGASPYSSATIP